MQLAKINMKSHHYSVMNELWSAVTHGVGIMLAITALVLLAIKGALSGSVLETVALVGFGISLVVLYTASTLFHALYFTKARKVFQVLDHSSIYILIAGSYLPYSLLAIGGTHGIVLLATIWALCLTGVLLDCFFVGRFKKLEVGIYVLLGWLCLTGMSALWASLGAGGFFLLLSGGVAYTLGALLYLRPNTPYIHVIWHMFVMLGSACMFCSIYFFI
ncbi:hemolysin III family protein [Lacticaseibacillus pabuli]|uniref:Hemolysin III family protein n=1 Tax=Lacticaseibacillus pabuli TaxID=3025672 RepID=A0ABY7WN78_9LACO|nr:hemolysin III family protein [Lacticaseibacillus sp. KACC 23028]WDF81586.1 hemolysin III family protein [Lacticaseibacillus sp. KACC 23028]